MDRWCKTRTRKVERFMDRVFASFRKSRRTTIMALVIGLFRSQRVETTPWTDNLYTPALEARDGKVMIPDAPGWGVTINPEWLASAEYRISQRG